MQCINCLSNGLELSSWETEFLPTFKQWIITEITHSVEKNTIYMIQKKLLVRYDKMNGLHKSIAFKYSRKLNDSIEHKI